jgi:hypothetical protein
MLALRSSLIAAPVALAVAACGGQKPWHPEGRTEHNASHTVTCAGALSPDRTEERWICDDRGLFECFPSEPQALYPARIEAERLPSFDGSCHGALKALRANGLLR